MIREAAEFAGSLPDKASKAMREIRRMTRETGEMPVETWNLEELH